VEEELRGRPRKWLVTGAAGFIGSHLVERLLRLGQKVVGLDNFATGKRENLFHVKNAVGDARWRGFRFIEGDIRRLETCREACGEAEYVLHEAALGSVPRSIDDPIASTDNNVGGFLNMLVAARDAGVSRFVYASSSAVFGDHPAMPKVEAQIGAAVSPYGLSKHINELYAAVFARLYGFDSIGLRYFNVFGPRQDPDGAYPSVIPAFIGALLRLTDAADLEVEIRQAILQQARVRIGVQRQLVLLHSLGRIVRPARVDRHIFVEARQTIVVIGRGTIRYCSRGGRLLRGSRSLRNHRVRRKQQGGSRNQAEMTKRGGTQKQSHEL